MTKTRVDPGTSKTLLGAVLSEVNTLRQRVDGHDKVLAPAFASTPMREAMTAEPEPYHFHPYSGSRSGLDWSRFPDHDPDYLAGRITLEQATARHQRPDEGCQCPNCTVQRQQADHRYAMPEPERQARCPFCHGTGFTGLPAGVGWASCTACDAEKFERLVRENYQGNQYSMPVAELQAARQRIIDCTECAQVQADGTVQGTGKTWQPIAPSPCSPCRGTGIDTHIVTPRGTLWMARNGSNGAGQYVQDTSGGKGVEQRTLFEAIPEPALPMPEAPGFGSELPDALRVRAQGAAITRNRPVIQGDSNAD
jgi:hypothetical protein